MLEPSALRNELCRLHESGYAWAVRCCRGDRVEAEDVLHQAYVKVLEGRARYEGRSAFKTWLFGVIRITAREQARKSWLRRLGLERWERDRRASVPDSENDGDEQARGLRLALRRLSTRQQEVLHLVFYQDLTIEQAAGVLGLSVGTARTHYERGKARLRGLLALGPGR